jgi:hypothetical protein
MLLLLLLLVPSQVMMWIVLPILLRSRVRIEVLLKRLGVGWGVPESTMGGIVCKV